MQNMCKYAQSVGALTFHLPFSRVAMPLLKLPALTSDDLDEVHQEKLMLARDERDVLQKPAKRKPTFTAEQRAKAGANSKAGRRKDERAEWSLASYVNVPDLPPDCRGDIVKRLATLSRFLDREIIEKYGQVSVTKAAQCETVLAWSAHILKLRRWEKRQYKEMSLQERANWSEAIASACARRDKALEKLALDAPPDAADDVWSNVIESVPSAAKVESDTQ